ncbi:NAD(P)H-hydrate epimerase [hydrothermal vent metagenome]|uniref:NAD(P)H-hydrate epimerase n=1 Tax=hydrothermal vent metagenome TaxID=652676 RepID=A0A3B0VTX2_9ZZZZ
MNFPWATEDVPFVDTQQMIEVDRAMIEDFHIDLIQMMENAGRNLAHLARHRFLDGNPVGKTVVVLAGTGGNGGGGLVAAHRLHNYGAKIQLFITKADAHFTPVPRHQLDIVRRMGINVGFVEDLDKYRETAVSPHLILDGIIGYSLRGAPRGSAAELIRWANQQNAPILALDTPSGVDTSSGVAFTPAIQATATMTLALPKAGLLTNNVAAQVGELYLADISVPPALYANPALQLAVGHLFAQSDIIRLKSNQ